MIQTYEQLKFDFEAEQAIRQEQRRAQDQRFILVLAENKHSDRRFTDEPLTNFGEFK